MYTMFMMSLLSGIICTCSFKSSDDDLNPSSHLHKDHLYDLTVTKVAYFSLTPAVRLFFTGSAVKKDHEINGNHVPVLPCVSHSQTYVAESIMVCCNKQFTVEQMMNQL